MRTSARTDVTQAEVVTALRNCGADVFDTSRVGRGFPDLVVHWRGRVLLVEVKTATGKLTRDQVVFSQRWPVEIMRSAAEAYAFCGVSIVSEQRA